MLKLVVDNTVTEPEPEPEPKTKQIQLFLTFSPAKTAYIIFQNQILAVYN